MKRGFASIGSIGMMAGLTAVLLGGWSTGPAAAQEQEKEEEETRIVISGLGSSGGYLGVQLEEVDGEDVGRLGLPEERGALVVDVVEDAPAGKAGLRDGDVILSWNGERVESAAELARRVRETPPGRTVRLGVFRDGRQQEIRVELGDRSERLGAVRFRRMPELEDRMRELGERIRDRGFGPEGYVFFGRPRLGVTVSGLTDQLAEYFGVEGGEGVLVTSVAEDSPARKAGLRAGDVIVAVAGEEVEKPGDIARALHGRDAGPVEVRIVRDHREQTVTVELEEEDSDLGFGGRGFYFRGDGVRLAPRARVLWLGPPAAWIGPRPPVPARLRILRADVPGLRVELPAPVAPGHLRVRTPSVPLPPPPPPAVGAVELL